jgi:hypothetical protein
LSSNPIGRNCGIFPATTNCLAFALFRVLLVHCNILLTCTIRSFVRQADTSGAVDASADPSSAKEIDMAETNEEPLAATGEDPVVETRKASVAETSKAPVAETRKAFVVETREDFVAGTNKASVAKTNKASVAKTSKAPLAETRKAFVVETREDHPMVETSEDHPVVTDFENLQKLGNGGVEAAASAARSFAGSFQMFADEATDYSKKSLESGSAFIEKLRAAKSLESAIQIQSDYAKSAYAEFLAYLVKMSDLYCNLFKRGATPIEKAAAKIEGVKT